MQASVPPFSRCSFIAWLLGCALLLAGVRPALAQAPDAPLAPQISNVTQSTAHVLPHGGNEKQRLSWQDVAPWEFIELSQNGHWAYLTPAMDAAQAQSELSSLGGAGNVSVTKEQSAGGSAATNAPNQQAAPVFTDPMLMAIWSLGDGTPSYPFSDYYIQWDS